MIGVDKYAAKVPAAQNSRISGDLPPGCAAVLATEQALIHNRQHAAPGSSRHHSQADAPLRLSRKPFGASWFPRGAFIRRNKNLRFAGLVAIARFAGWRV